MQPASPLLLLRRPPTHSQLTTGAEAIRLTAKASAFSLSPVPSPERDVCLTCAGLRVSTSRSPSISKPQEQLRQACSTRQGDAYT